MNTNQPPDDPEQKHSVEPTAAIDQISGCPPIEVFREPDLPCTAPRSISRNTAKGTGKSGARGVAIKRSGIEYRYRQKEEAEEVGKKVESETRFPKVVRPRTRAPASVGASVLCSGEVDGF